MSAFNAVHFFTPLICFDVQDSQELQSLKHAIFEHKGPCGGQETKDAVDELLTVTH